MTKEKPSVVQQSWADFVKDYDLVVQFGERALKEKLSEEQGLQSQDKKQVKGLIKGILASIENNMDVDARLDKMLNNVTQKLEQLQTPRAKSTQPELEARAETGEARKFEPVPWGGKIDIASDANYRNLQDAFDEFNAKYQAEPQARDALLNQFKNKLKMDMKQRLEARLTAAPKMTSTIKLKKEF